MVVRDLNLLNMILLDQNMKNYLRIGLLEKYEKIYEENRENKIKNILSLSYTFLTIKLIIQ